MITNATLAQQIADLVEDRQNIDKQFQEWITGAVGGGVSSDGRYPLTDYFGIERYTLSPAQLEENVTGLVDSSSAHAAAALASEAAAALSAGAASTDEGLADGHRLAALAAQAAAELAEASSVNASVNATASQVAAAASEAAAALSETNADASAAAALVSELAAAASALAAAAFDPVLFAALADNETVAGHYTFNNDLGITIGNTLASLAVEVRHDNTDYGGVIMEDLNEYGVYFKAGGYQYTIGSNLNDTYVDSGNPAFGDSMSYSIGFINEGWNASLAEWGFYGDSLFQFGQYVIDGGWAVYVTETTAGNWKYPMACNTSQQETLFTAYPLVIGNSGGTWAAGLVSKGLTYATLSEDGTDFSFALTGLTDLNFTGMTAVNVPSLVSTGVVTGSNLAVANWNTAFGWGDHALGGYADGTNEANWDTAFGWGDHSLAGYQPAGSYSLTSHTHTFAELTAKPTTIAGYGITDLTALINANTNVVNAVTAFGWGDHAGLYSLLAHTHTLANITDFDGSWGDVTGKPTTFTPSAHVHSGADITTGTVADARIASSLARLASPVFTGNPTAPTPLTADNDTSIATTAFVKAQGYVTSVGSTYLNHVTAGYTSADVSVSASAPGSPSQGDIWFDTDAELIADELAVGAIVTGEGGIPYYDDATYVGGKITVASSAPGSPAKGDIWIDTT